MKNERQRLKTDMVNLALVCFFSMVFLSLWWMGSAYAGTGPAKVPGLDYDHGIGWFWYQDPVLEKEKPKKKEEKPKLPPIIAPISNRDFLKKVGEDLEEATATAMLYPTQTNMLKQIVLEKAVLDLSLKFAALKQYVHLQNPKLTYNFDTIPAIKNVSDKLEEENYQKALLEFAKTHGLILFVKSDCRYCEAFAPIIQEFCKDYNLNLTVVSIDGKPITVYPEAKENQYLADKLEVYKIPSLFAFNPKTEQFYSISTGAVSYTDLGHNFRTLFKILKEQSDA